jgi:hypothetical protein
VKKKVENFVKRKGENLAKINFWEKKGSKFRRNAKKK